MTNDIEDRFNGLGITDRPDSMISLGSKPNEEKELRRISLPTDAHRRSKFASWVQYNLPTPPSSRNNSRKSRSSSVRSSTSESTSSPGSSPTSLDTPQLPIAPVPTRSLSSTQPPPRSTSLPQEERYTPLRSISEPNQEKKKKRFLPLVSRIRLNSYDKPRQRAMDPPEPPPQLLMSALHCDDDKEQEKRKSHADLDDTLAWLEEDQSPPPPRMRRRSSCPPRPLDHTTLQESVILRSFVSPSTPSSPIVASPLPPEQDIYDQDQCLLSFSQMKPRSRPLRRRTSGKREKKACRAWHDSLLDSIKKDNDEGTWTSLSNEKRERHALTRKFILREFYLTEVTFWNQLYYSKVMFGDPLQLSLDRHSAFTRTSDLDIFSNLPDLMQCSAQLIRAMGPCLDNTDDILLGKEICAMANQFVVFLRCAVDYKLNRKKLDQRSQHNKGFAMYQEKLSLRKETNQFYVHDYLIIPIQRVARYGLLLADLQKHTDTNHPDYPHIRRARMILTSLAVAMNQAQH